jgi:RNA polymerase sigma-70 factor (ECF subfamily)
MMATKSNPGAVLRLVPGARTSAAPPRSPGIDDSELLAAVRAGDPSVAAAFHDRLRAPIERTVGRLLGHGDPDREDLVQLALIELVTSVDRYRGECSLDGWASTLAAHVVYKHIRRRKLERRLFAAMAPEALAATRSQERLGRAAILRSAAIRVQAHLEHVDQAKAWAFLLHDVCGFDLQEMARILGVTVAAAQTRLVRGRREVHERIAEDPELANVLESLEGEL